MNLTPSRRSGIFYAILFVCLHALAAFAQSSGGNQQVTQSVIAGGGGSSSSASTRVDGTVGQSVTGTSSGGAFSLSGGFWPDSATLIPSTLSVPDVTAVYGSTVSLSATLSANGSNLSNQLVTFSLNSMVIGTAATDINGVATLSAVSLSTINAGTYTGGINAQFAGDATFAAATTAANLTVQQATPLLQVAGGTFTYDGQPHPAAASITGVNGEALAPISVLYNGIATLPINAGTYAVTATFYGNQNYTAVVNNQQSIVINQAGQTISFGALSAKTYGDAPFNASATGGPSGNAVTFSSQTPAVCSVSGNTVTILSAGNCTIRASQAGNGNYSAAIPVDQSFTVNRATATITLSNLAQVYDGTTKSAAASTTPSGLTVNFTYGQNGSAIPAPTDAGSYDVTATINDANYQGSANGVLVINKATQTITFGPLAQRTFGDSDFTLNATTTSGLSVSFSAAGQCTASGNLVHLAAAGSCTITASQAGNANYGAAADVSQTFSIAQATTATALTSSANPAGFGQSVTFTATVTAAASTTTATPSGTVQFQSGGVNLGGPVTLSSGGVATLSTSSLTPGTHAITALYSGDASFAASTGTLTPPQSIGAQSALSVNDVTQVEGNAGTTAFVFTISLTASSTQTVAVNYATSDGAATTAENDYQATSGTLSFAPGETTRTLTVLVNGDTTNEPDETFAVTLSAPTNAVLSRAQGTATILNDDAPGIQLSAATYTVGEGDRSAAITVTRAGDLSQPASINYATIDQAGLQPCDAVTGLASQRCDYGLTLGLLRFASGEAARTITVPVIDDGYPEGPETFTLTLQNPQGAALGANSSATVTIIDNDSVNGTNPLDKAAFFIRQHYLDFLNREPEPEGLTGWLNILNTCPPSGRDASGIACDRVEVSSDFYRSEEFQQRGYFIYRFYAAGLGRTPRYADFMPDLARVTGFLTTMDLETMKQTFVQVFINRPEFRQKYDATQNDAAGYVKLLEQTAGVKLSIEQQLIAGLESGAETRATALRKVVESPEVAQKFYNEAFVVEAYFGYLRRDPDALYLQWLQTVNQSSDGYRVLVNGFANSPEYRQRFGP